jgi:hypothetical protein
VSAETEDLGEARVVTHLTDLVDPEIHAEDPRLALCEAARLARRAGLVFRPGDLTVAEVLALADARERLELERTAVLEGVLRDLVRALRGEPGDAGETAKLDQLARAIARVGSV